MICFPNFCCFSEAQTFTENTNPHLDELNDLQKQVNEKRKELDKLKSELQSLTQKIEEKRSHLKQLSNEITNKQANSSPAVSKSFSDFISIPKEQQKSKSTKSSVSLNKSKSKERQTKQNVLKIKLRSPSISKSSSLVSRKHFVVFYVCFLSINLLFLIIIRQVQRNHSVFEDPRVLQQNKSQSLLVQILIVIRNKKLKT